jgi:hypothetical protein
MTSCPRDRSACSRRHRVEVALRVLDPGRYLSSRLVSWLDGPVLQGATSPRQITRLRSKIRIVTEAVSEAFVLPLTWSVENENRPKRFVSVRFG